MQKKGGKIYVWTMCDQKKVQQNFEHSAGCGDGAERYGTACGSGNLREQNRHLIDKDGKRYGENRKGHSL